MLLFSLAFTNTDLNDADPVVMSNVGLVMIVIWGLADNSLTQLDAKDAFAGVFHGIYGAGDFVWMLFLRGFFIRSAMARQAGERLQELTVETRPTDQGPSARIPP